MSNKEKNTNKIVLLLLAMVILLILVVFSGRSYLPKEAFAGTPKTADEGIQVVSIQLERDSYGLAMVDNASQTLWIYQIDRRNPQNQLKLIAARSWRYDRMLQQYNTADPKPEQVRKMLKDMSEHYLKGISKPVPEK